MVANRDSIAKVGLPLCDAIIDGDAGTAKVIELAQRLRKLLTRSGTYRKQYEDHEQRVLYRHLNLYRNKLKAAETTRQREHWQEKVTEQRAKIAAFEAKGRSLDLDGL